jgi:hypothetical protein
VSKRRNWDTERRNWSHTRALRKAWSNKVRRRRDTDSQAWFWTEEWQAMEREADQAIAAGETKTFDSVEEFLEELDQLKGLEDFIDQVEEEDTGLNDVERLAEATLRWIEAGGEIDRSLLDIKLPEEDQ